MTRLSSVIQPEKVASELSGYVPSMLQRPAMIQVIIYRILNECSCFIEFIKRVEEKR